MVVFAIDPGNVESAYVFWNGVSILKKGKVKNKELLNVIEKTTFGGDDKITIEMVASYGMPVGKTVFDTCVWIGRFAQICEEIGIKWDLAYRIDIKNHLCHSSKAKDSNVIQALVDRFGNVDKFGKYSKGTKNNKGFFYEFSQDIWQAFAVAVYSFDNL
jgi:hypothetical protein